jgi:PAS domain S-box-containing protein
LTIHGHEVLTEVPKQEEVELRALAVTAPDAIHTLDPSEDPSERKRAEEALMEERRLLRTLMDNLPDHIYFKDRESRFTHINLALVKGLGLQEAGMALGKTDFDFFPEEDARQSLADEQEIMRTGRAIVGKEEGGAWPDGRVTWVSTTKMPLRDAKGNIVGTFGISRDITKRKCAEEALIEERHLLHCLMDNLPDLIYFKDREGHFTQINLALTRKFDLDHPAQAVGKTDFDFLDPEHAEEFQKDDAELLRTGQFIVGKEEKAIWPDGHVTWVSTTKMPLRDANGNIIGTFGVSRDITERKRVEAALIEERHLLHCLMEYLPEVIYFKDRESRFTRINKAHAKLFGLSDPAQAVGKTDFDFFTAEHAQGAYGDEQEIIRTGQPIVGKEEKETWPDGRVTWVSTTKVPLRDANGNIMGTFGVSRDITGRKQVEAEMAERHLLATLVAEVGVALTQAESLRQGLQQCAEILIRNIGAAFARVWTMNGEANVLELQASAGLCTHIDGGHARVPLGKSKIGRIAESGEAQLTNSLQDDSEVGDPEWARREGMAAFAGYPLKVEGRVLGVVAAFARQPFTKTTLQAVASVADNTAQFIKRKRAEQELRLTQFSVEHASDSVFWLDPQGRIVYANEAACQSLERSRDELLSSTVPDIHPHFSMKDWETLWEKIKARGSLTLETEHQTKQGRVFPVEVTANYLEFDGKEYSFAFARDITERKRAEEALRESDEKYRVLYESSRDAITTISPPEWKFDAGNPAATVLFGARDEQEFMAAAPWSLSPEYQPGGELSSVKARQMIDAAMERGTHSFEWTHKKFSGEKFIATVTLTRMSYRGKPLLQATVRDITDRKRAEAEMAERHLLATLVAEVGVALVQAESLRPGLQQCAEILARNIGAAFARVWTVNEKANVLELQASAGLYTHIDGGHARVPLGKFKIGRIAESGEPHLTNTVLEDSWVGDPEWARGEGMVAFAGYPLKVEGRVLGVVAAFARQPFTKTTLQAVASVADNTAQFIKRKRAEEELYQSRQMLQTILDTIPQRVFWKDRSISYLGCNKAFAIDAGLKDPAEIIGKNDYELAWRETAEHYRADDKLVMDGETPRLNFDEPQDRPDGSQSWLRSNKLPLRDAEGKVIGLLGTYEDITERKRVKTQLATQARIDEIFLSVPDGEIYSEILKLVLGEMHSPLGLFGFIDEDEGLEVPSMTPEIMRICQMPGKTARFPRETWGEGSWARALKEKRTIYSNEPSTSTPDGHIHICRHISLPILFRGEALGLLVVANKETDYTQVDVRALDAIASHVAPILSARLHRQRAEATRDYLASIVEFSGDAIVGKGPEGVIQTWNAGAEKLYGYEASEVIGQSIFLIVPPERRKEVEDILNRIKRDEQIAPRETVRVTKDGRRIDVSIAISSLKNARGEVVGASTVARDITARKRVEQDLLFKTALLEAESETALDGILVVDTADHVLLVNKQFTRMLNIPEEVIRTNGDNKLIEHVLTQLKDPDAFLEGMNYLHSHEREKTRGEIEFKDGRVFDRYSSPLQDSTGKLYGRIWYFRDITQRSELARMKSELVSVVSHELRTPLTSIRGALGLLSGGLLRSQPEKGERMLKIAVSNTDRLVRLINDILDLERLESGKMNLEKRTCNAADLMTQAADNVRDLADKAGVTLSVSLHLARLWVDPDRIIQALINLISNAIKFSPRGSTIWLSVTPQADQIQFQVKDKGRGIPQEKRESIFERFQQVDASDRREKGGTGLGLPITRSIVQQHGGRIWVESALGQGSTFSFTLPSLLADAIMVGAGSGSRKLLVCAVEAEVGDAVQAVLNRRGYTVLASSSWPELTAMASTESPDVILLDSSLPGMESLENITALKQKSHTEEVPVIGLGDMAPDTFQLASMGMAGWVTKPVNQDSLLPVLESVLGKLREGPRVLVVEDDTDLARVLTTIFERHGAVVLHAQTGQEAVQVCPQFIPDLLVLDVILPELDGFGVVEQLRQHEHLRHLPLAVYSVKELDDLEKERLRLGESIFMTKSRLTPQEFEQRAIGLLDWATSGQRERRRR